MLAFSNRNGFAAAASQHVRFRRLFYAVLNGVIENIFSLKVFLRKDLQAKVCAKRRDRLSLSWNSRSPAWSPACPTPHTTASSPPKQDAIQTQLQTLLHVFVSSSHLNQPDFDISASHIEYFLCLYPGFCLQLFNLNYVLDVNK